MFNKEKIIKNASWIVGARVVQSVLSLFISMITARYLGPSNFGIINYAASIVAFVIPIMHLGLTSILVQEFVDKPTEEGKILGTSLVTCFFSSLLCFAGVICFTFIANVNENEVIVVCLLYSLLIFAQVFDVFGYWFQAHLLSKYTSLISLGAYVFVSIYKIFLLVNGKSVRWFAISNSLDYFIIAFFLYIFYKRIGGQKLMFSRDLFLIMFNKSKYYIIADLMVAVFAQTDRIMLKLMLDESATGFYSAALNCAGVTNFIFAAIIDSGRPSIFECKKNNQKAFENNICRLYTIIFYLSLIQSLIIFLLSDLIILILYGEAFLPASAALKIVTWYSAFSYLGSVRNIWMLAENKQRMIWIINVSGAIANILLNFILIPLWGILGAASASLITQIFTNVIMGWIIKDIRVNNKLMIKALTLNSVKNVLKLLKK